MNRFKSPCVTLFLGLLLIFCSACGAPGSPDPQAPTLPLSNHTPAAALTDAQRESLITFLGETYPPRIEHTPPVDIVALGRCGDAVLCSYLNGTDTAMVEVILGGYKIASGVVNNPSGLGLYVVTDENQVFTLQDAYTQGVVNIAEAYPLVPDGMKQGATIEEDLLYPEGTPRPR